MDLEPEPQLRAAEARRVIPAIAVGSDGKFFGPGARTGKWEVADRPVSTTRLTGVPDAEGNEVRVREQPWQTNAAYMVASGKYSLKAVAAACDKSYDAVKALFRNGWFQEKVALIQQQNGAGDLMDVFKAECASSLVTLVELRDDSKAPASVRRACAVDIIDRVYGKPTQRVEQETALSVADPVAEVARLEAENARLRGDNGGSRSEMTEALSLSDSAHSVPRLPVAAAGSTGDQSCASVTPNRGTTN